MGTLPEIATLLKTLKLSGILDSLATRNREAIEHKLSFTEFLSTCLQDEIIRREQKKFASRFKKSGINVNKTLEQFDFMFNPKINQALIKDVACGQFIEEKAPILIVGPCGTGKSHVAQAIGHCMIRKGIDATFFTQTQLFKFLQAARATGQYDKKFQTLIKAPLLIIDDFGLKPLRSPEDEDLHDIIAERYEKASTIVTSNLAFDEWGDAFPNKLLGAATIDRLAHAAYKIILEGGSYRSAGRAKNKQSAQK
jgi:DNA replication protein DnaC